MICRFFNPKVPRVFKLSHFSAARVVQEVCLWRQQRVLRLQPCIVEQSPELSVSLKEKNLKSRSREDESEFDYSIFQIPYIGKIMKQAACSAISH